AFRSARLDLGPESVEGRDPRVLLLRRELGRTESVRGTFGRVEVVAGGCARGHRGRDNPHDNNRDRRPQWGQSDSTKKQWKTHIQKAVPCLDCSLSCSIAPPAYGAEETDRASIVGELENRARLLELEARQLRHDLRWVAVADVAQEVRLDPAVREEL